MGKNKKIADMIHGGPLVAFPLSPAMPRSTNPSMLMNHAAFSPSLGPMMEAEVASRVGKMLAPRTMLKTLMRRANRGSWSTYIHVMHMKMIGRASRSQINC